MPTVLVVDDDEMIRSQVAVVLRAAGFGVQTACDGVAALEVIATHAPDLIVLDVLMPRADGRSVLATLRGRGDWTPVILLTGVGAAGQRADALDSGADDYLNKPFDQAELLARIRAVLRRDARGRTLAHAHTIVGGGVEMDRQQRTASVHSRALALTPKAWALLEFLMLNHGQTFTREELLARVWGIEFAITTRAVDHRVAEIRKALAARGVDDVIDTVQGVGYRFHPKAEAR